MRPKKCAQKSSRDTFSIYISRKNKMKYSLLILKNKNLFKRHKYPFPNALNTKYFLTLSYNHWGFWVSLNYPVLNFKKTVCPKNVWMRHWMIILGHMHLKNPAARSCRFVKYVQLFITTRHYKS